MLTYAISLIRNEGPFYEINIIISIVIKMIIFLKNKTLHTDYYFKFKIFPIMFLILFHFTKMSL